MVRKKDVKFSDAINAINVIQWLGHVLRMNTSTSDRNPRRTLDNRPGSLLAHLPVELQGNIQLATEDLARDVKAWNTTFVEDRFISV